MESLILKPTWLDMLLLALATWRIANMLTSEHGPWHIFGKMRRQVPLGGLTTCIYCMSVWVALILVPIYLFVPIIIWVFAISGAALMLRSYTGAGHDV